MIEIWLSGGGVQLRLPVLPPEIAVSTANGTERSTLQEIGEVILGGKRKLRTLAISSYFPARYDSNCSYRAIPSPAVAAAQLQSWCENASKIRLLITGGAVSVNMLVLLEQVTITMGKQPGDVAYSMDITEYRPLVISAI